MLIISRRRVDVKSGASESISSTFWPVHTCIAFANKHVNTPQLKESTCFGHLTSVTFTNPLESFLTREIDSRISALLLLLS